MADPGEKAQTEQTIAHMKAYHGCPDCFDPDLDMPGLGERMHEMHVGYHSGEGPSANFGGTMKPHVHERIDSVFHDRRE